MAKYQPTVLLKMLYYVVLHQWLLEAWASGSPDNSAEGADVDSAVAQVPAVPPCPCSPEAWAPDHFGAA